jgi:hypothetical protein
LVIALPTDVPFNVKFERLAVDAGTADVSVALKLAVPP